MFIDLQKPGTVMVAALNSYVVCKLYICIFSLIPLQVVARRANIPFNGWRCHVVSAMGLGFVWMCVCLYLS